MRGKEVIFMSCIGFVLIAILYVHVGSRGRANTPYLGRDEKSIKQHLSSCSDDVDSLKASGALVVFDGYLYGRQHWDAFLKKVENREKCSVDVVTFSPGSYLVRSYFEYNGNDFYQLIDYTRLPENSAGLSGYQCHIYKDFNCIDIPKKGYEALNIPATDGPVKLAVFSNTEIPTYDDLIEYIGSDDREYFWGFKLWPQEKSRNFF